MYVPSCPTREAIRLSALMIKAKNWEFSTPDLTAQMMRISFLRIL